MPLRWRWRLRQLTGQLWFRATLFAALGVVVALLGVMADRFVPAEIPELVGADAVGSVLNILASSMLAVTTFSLGAMVSAQASASSNVTPRATRLLLRDSTSQNALATFVGSFLFALVGIVTLTVQGYGQRGRLVLFIATVVVIGLVVATLLRWIDHLSRMGQMGETSARVEKAAHEALVERVASPSLGGRPLDQWFADKPNAEVSGAEPGYVQHLDMAALQQVAERADLRIRVRAVPGAYVHGGVTLVEVAGAPDDDDIRRLREAFSVAADRSFEQDPRFGLIVLSEIGSRALSAAVNDSGTAIDVIGRLVRVLIVWADRGEPDEAPRYDRVFVPALDPTDLLDDAFFAIARDAGNRLEIHLRLQKALLALAQCEDPAFTRAVRAFSLESHRRASDALGAEDRDRFVRETTEMRA